MCLSAATRHHRHHDVMEASTAAVTERATESPRGHEAPVSGVLLLSVSICSWIASEAATSPALVAWLRDACCSSATRRDA
jgi:hypothetical protein